MFINFWKWLIFKIGDLRWIGWKHFPLIATWDCYESEINQYEIHEAMEYIKPGDIIILLHEGFAGNLGIGGALVHAAMVTSKIDVIEALSDDQGGVVKRHIAQVLQADKAVILRPKLDKESVEKGIKRIEKILGFKYDIFFDFNTEKEDEIIQLDFETAKAGKVKFCCTEIPHYAYLKDVEKLELFRILNESKIASILRLIGFPIGTRKLTADMYLDANLDIIWMSKNCTSNWLAENGCHERIIRKVQDFEKKK